MFTVDRTDVFAKWLKKLKDRRDKGIILNHIDNMEEGKFGLFEPVSGGLYENRLWLGIPSLLRQER